MALNMRVSTRYGTHLPVLLAALRRTSGPVLELGVGAFSTPILHVICMHEERYLQSYETNRAYYEWASVYQCRLHDVDQPGGWDDALIERDDIDRDQEWSVALVDHSPSERRVVEIERLAQCCNYVILHDSNGRYESQYHYSTIYPLYRYKWDYTAETPSTTVLSNFVDLKDFSV